MLMGSRTSRRDWRQMPLLIGMRRTGGVWLDIFMFSGLKADSPMNSIRVLAIPLALITVALSGCDMLKDKSIAEEAVTDFHQKLNDGNFQPLYSNADDALKSAATEKDFLALLGAIHKKLGKVQSSSETNFSINDVNFVTKIVLVYDTKFDGGDATETFTYRLSGDQAKV